MAPNFEIVDFTPSGNNAYHDTLRLKNEDTNEKYVLFSVFGEDGQNTIIFDDNEEINAESYRWSIKNKYAYCPKDSGHIFVMKETDSHNEQLAVDHINRVCVDNRRPNLRMANDHEQCLNRS